MFSKPTMFLPVGKPALFNWLNHELMDSRLSRELHDLADYDFDKLVAICHYPPPDNALDISEYFADAAAAQGLAPTDKGPFAMFNMVWHNLVDTDGKVVDLDPVEPVFQNILGKVQGGYLCDPNQFLAIGEAWVYLIADYGDHWAIQASHKFYN